MLANTRAKVRLLSTDAAPAPQIPGATAVKAYDQHTSGGTARLLLYAVGTTFVAMAASAAEAPWTWPEVTTIAARQQAKLM